MRVIGWIFHDIIGNFFLLPNFQNRMFEKYDILKLLGNRLNKSPNNLYLPSMIKDQFLCLWGALRTSNLCHSSWFICPSYWATYIKARTMWRLLRLQLQLIQVGYLATFRSQQSSLNESSQAGKPRHCAEEEHHSQHQRHRHCLKGQLSGEIGPSNWQQWYWW